MQVDLGRPNPKQELFFKDRHRHCAFGGARGGGKSWALRAKAIMLALKYPGITIMVIRKTYPELIANHIRPLKKLLKIGTKECPIVYNESKKEMRFPNGSIILFGYCNAESDTDRYQGTEVDVLFLDESTQLSEQQIKDLNACVRGVNSFPKRTYYTCNPGSKSHGYHKRVFVDRDFMADEYPEDYNFIQSLVYDNKDLLEADPEYLRALENLPDARRKAWLEGDWNSFVGQAFPEIRLDYSHASDRRWTHVIDDIQNIPQSWTIIRGFDFGYSKPFSVLWVAVEPHDRNSDGRMYVFKEWYGCTKQPNTGLMLTAQEIAQGIRDREESDPRLRGRKILGIADPAIWESSHGESIAEMMEKCGVWFNKGDHARLAGKMQFHYRLAMSEEGFPMVYFCRECTELLRCLPLLIYDERPGHEEDIDTSLEDHCYDALRYIFMEHPLNPRKNIKRFTDKDPLPPDDPLNIYTVKETKHGR